MISIGIFRRPSKFGATSEVDSSRIDLYGELGKVNFERWNSYYMVGQDVVLVDDAESEPIVTELAADALPTWE